MPNERPIFFKNYIMLSVLTSSVGKKYIMAVTGIILCLFVTGHMLGNLHLFMGAQALNHYAHFLQGLGPILWLIRLVMAATLLIHIIFGTWLYFGNRSARPVKYHKLDTVEVSIPGRIMIYTGALVLAYLVYHILHFTIQSIDPSFLTFTDTEGYHDVFHMVVVGYGNFIASAIYMIGMIILGLHIYHGGSSLFQSLGLSNPKYRPLIDKIGPLWAVVVGCGFFVVPLVIVCGWVK
jgi:succinate dehydrogenase / fumarate reductase cytochrome b subunit